VQKVFLTQRRRDTEEKFILGHGGGFIWLARMRGPWQRADFASMILFPAIDLKDGHCVRLKRGAMDEATIYNDDPAAQAASFEAQGFEWLHCVDLNGAFAGASVNRAAIQSIRTRIKLPIQLGGGIRDRAGIDAWLEAGIARVILGTVALREPQLVKDAARAHPGRIAVGIDARDGKVAVEGWAETSEMAARDLARRFEDAGVAAIIFTDIARDGMLQGVNVEATAKLAASISVPVIASGGVAGIGDIDALRAAKEPNILGVVIGRALYDGRIDPAAALARARGH
jgi:phosphoribosylformimino-5-aminoimidazole carboxamide ribotide isomerase